MGQPQNCGHVEMLVITSECLLWPDATASAKQASFTQNSVFEWVCETVVLLEVARKYSRKLKAEVSILIIT